MSYRKLTKLETLAKLQEFPIYYRQYLRLEMWQQDTLIKLLQRFFSANLSTGCEISESDVRQIVDDVKFDQVVDVNDDKQYINQ